MREHRTKQAGLVCCEWPELDVTTGRARIGFRIDGEGHVVHALFHDLPTLARGQLDTCLRFLAMTCLVDVCVATMAKRVVLGPLRLGRLGAHVLRAAAEALRLEVLAEQHGPMALRTFRIVPGQRGQTVEPKERPVRNRVLLLMGGGKDSLYAFHVLRAAGYDVHLFYLTEARRTWQQLRRVYRHLVPFAPQYRAFLDANRRSRLERQYGSAYLSQFQIGQVVAASLPYALAHRCRYLALGLERSSDTPMSWYRGRAVNHQAQKSSSFIRLLNRYLRWQFKEAVEIISPLHGLYDLGIYARFLRDCPDLAELQSSCGGANSWRSHCGECEKCAFIAALLFGLSPDPRLYKRLFTVDPLKNGNLVDDWLGKRAVRPLACVGFAEEMALGLMLGVARGRRPPVDRSLMERWKSRIGPGELRHYARSHPNAMIPSAMSRRLRPHLRYQVSDLTNLLRPSM